MHGTRIQRPFTLRRNAWRRLEINRRTDPEAEICRLIIHSVKNGEAGGKGLLVCGDDYIRVGTKGAALHGGDEQGGRR